MTEHIEMIEISWAAGSIDEARKVSRYLVQERWAASAKIVPWIESIYMWNNQLETDQEAQVIFKTRKEYLPLVLEAIKQNTKYQIPEIMWRTLEGVNEEYFDWLRESTARATESTTKI